MSAVDWEHRTEPLAPRAEPDLERGALIGRYIVLHRLGGGGMGVVYVAYDPELDRRLVVKLLRSTANDETQARTRLLREAQALARLQHPNVIAVHDVGTLGDDVFIAMEYVEGLTLRGWLNERKRTVEEIVDIFLQAGRGLAAAHAAGLVHRDFKPENTLVGKDGRARVLDFGLAHAATATATATAGSSDAAPQPDQIASSSTPIAFREPLTRTGALMGTPGYMAPEQFQARSTDARTDQFSFCVALFEALHGRRPFEGATLTDLASAVTAGRMIEPREPGPPHLRAILLRGLRVDANERFHSMNAVLDELVRDPRSARRRRWAYAIGALSLMAVASILVGVVRLVRHARIAPCRGMEQKLDGVWDPATRATVENAFAASGIAGAGTTAQQLATMLDGYTSAWVKARADACEATRVRGEQSERLLDLRVVCLDDRLNELRSLTRELSQPDKAIVDGALDAARQLARLEPCADKRALEAVVPPPNDPKLRARVDALREKVAQARGLADVGKYQAARDLARSVADESAPLGYAALRAEALLVQLQAEDNLGLSKEAEHTLVEALPLAGEAHDDSLMTTLWSTWLWLVSSQSNRNADAELLIPGGEAAVRRVADRDPTAVIDWQRVLGDVYARAGRFTDAQRMFEKSLALDVKRSDRDDNSVANDLYRLAITFLRQGKADEARDYFARTLTMKEKAFGPMHPEVAIAHNNLGESYALAGRFEEAHQQFEQALTIDEKMLGPMNPRVTAPLDGLGLCAMEQGRLDEAQRYLERELGVSVQAHGPDHPSLATPYMSLAKLLAKQHRLADARAAAARAVAVAEKGLGPDHPDVAEPLLVEAQVDLEERQFAVAQRELERSMQLVRTKLGQEHPLLVDGYAGLSRVALARGDAATAMAAGERAVRMGESLHVPGFELAEVRFVWAQALWSHDRKRALELADASRQTYAGAGAVRQKEVAEIDRWLQSRTAR
jgi:serine/threonine-protein kinase